MVLEFSKLMGKTFTITLVKGIKCFQVAAMSLNSVAKDRVENVLPRLKNYEKHSSGGWASDAILLLPFLESSSRRQGSLLKLENGRFSNSPTIFCVRFSSARQRKVFSVVLSKKNSLIYC